MKCPAFLVRSAFVLACWSSMAAAADEGYPGASITPKSQSGWEQLSGKVEPEAPLDEALGGPTRAGTKLQARDAGAFYTEPRNVFSQVDMVPTGPNGALQPLNYLEGGRVPPHGRDAIRGQNTWMLWGQGNEAFWDWLSQHGYGIADFLYLLDSQKRDSRFKDAGIVNQPGMKAQKEANKRILGLYIDEADGERIRLEQPPTDIDADTGKLAQRPAQGAAYPSSPFKPWDEKEYRQALDQLPKDGVDYAVYGYPSGVVGLRLFPNPDYFADTPAAAEARRYWKERVLDNKDPGAYYDRNKKIHADPKLVRPFRVSMSCAFCHIGPHPLNPPKDRENPEWANLSSIIGDQYWKPSANFSSLKDEKSFIWQFVASQQPGTIDTSLVSTDHINNANTINAVFDLLARLERAKLNPPEQQSALAMTLPGLEDGGVAANPRHTPRVLVDGSDSVGAFGALARVYLNIGSYSEQWGHLHNPVIGFKPQRPFELATMREKSGYWKVAESYRIPQLAAFFLYRNPKTGEHVTMPMKLADARPDDKADGKAILAKEAAAAAKGRAVFVANCVICHSSKQPDGFQLVFARDWSKQPTPQGSQPAKFVLPMDFADWEEFKRGPAYAEYVKRISGLAGSAGPSGDAFLKDNFLSTDVRVPVTLVGTNSGRAVATNAMRGQVWDNFSSEDYKKLPAVGPVRFYNPYLPQDKNKMDDWGNNDAYLPPGGGPGYYRPASLISLWATAPYLHNNALGIFNGDPSVAGRLKAFDDGIDRVLWKKNRKDIPTGVPGDLRRDEKGKLQIGDPGFIYRTTERSVLDFPANFIRPLLAGIVGESLLSFLTLYLWIGLAVVSVVLVFIGRQRHVGFVLALLALLIGVALRLTGIDTLYPAAWSVPVLLTVAAAASWLAPQTRLVPRLFFLVLAGGFVFTAVLVTGFVDGRRGPLEVGPIPRGTPVNLIMNMNPAAPLGALIDAGSGLTRGILRIRKENLPDDGSDLRAFEEEAGAALMRASKCPDFVLDRGHWFAEGLSDDDKRALKAFLKTL